MAIPTMPDLTLDLRHLRCAVAVSEQGSFRRAALALGLPESTVSRRVQSLEHRLGFLLFVRDQRGTTLTSAGAAFLRDALHGAKEISRAAQFAAKVHRGERGELRIGMLASLAPGFLHDTLFRFRERSPNLVISLREGTLEEMLRHLSIGDLDVSFIIGQPEVVDLTVKQFLTESVYVVLPQTHRLSDNDVVTWESLRKEPFIITAGGAGPEMHDYLVQKLSCFGSRPRIEVHDISRESLLALVTLGYGVTVARTSSVRKSIAGIVYRPIVGEEQSVPAGAVWVAGNKNPALHKLLSIADEVIAKWTSDSDQAGGFAQLS